MAGILPPAWLAGTAMLAVSKILDNMEIGHNVMHGQYDWMGDPGLNSRMYEWDNVCPSEQWKYSHNYMHHTYTNIVGMDRDVGYGILRMSEDQRWQPYYLGNPLYAVLLMMLFQYGVAAHELETENIRAGKITWSDKRGVLGEMRRKMRRQLLKDYVAFPLLAGPFAPVVAAGNLTANLTGGRLFHLLTGNLSFQIEHHLFPDIPAHRHAEISVEVRQICERYGIPYDTGPLHRQFGTVVRKIVRLALPPKQKLAELVPLRRRQDPGAAA